MRRPKIAKNIGQNKTFRVRGGYLSSCLCDVESKAAAADPTKGRTDLLQFFPPARHWAGIDVQPNQPNARKRPAKVEGQADGDEADGEEEDAKYGHLQLLSQGEGEADSKRVEAAAFLHFLNLSDLGHHLTLLL